MSEWWEPVAALATLLTAIAIFVTTIFVYGQAKTAKQAYQKSSKTTEADIMLRIYGLFYKEHIWEIIMRLDNDEPILTGDKPVKTNELDDFLGVIGLLSQFIDNGVLEKNIVNEMLGWYIVKSMNNKEINDYVKSFNEKNMTFTGIVKLGQDEDFVKRWPTAVSI